MLWSSPTGQLRRPRTVVGTGNAIPAPGGCSHTHSLRQVGQGGGQGGVLGAPPGTSEGSSLVAFRCALRSGDTSPGSLGFLPPHLPSSPPWWLAAWRKEDATLPQ